MRYRPTPTCLAALVVTLAVTLGDIGHSAPRRPSHSASACSISSDKFNQLAAKHPSGAQACKNMADNAQAHGGSFSFMCDAATGQISCCNDSTCVSLGSALKGRLPGLRPDQLPGALHHTPSQLGGKPGMVPPGGMTGPSQTR
jgi:hypothetical protein